MIVELETRTLAQLVADYRDADTRARAAEEAGDVEAETRATLDRSTIHTLLSGKGHSLLAASLGTERTRIRLGIDGDDQLTGARRRITRYVRSHG